MDEAILATPGDARQVHGGTGPRPLQFASQDPVLGLVLIAAALLLFWSLDDRYLWQDEAETALLGKSILRHGVPIASDGTNVVSQEASLEFVEGSSLPYFLWRWSPWIQFYIVAGSMALLGPTTLAARLPFACLGVVAVFLTYKLALRLFASVGIARLAAFYLTLSVPFLLHARQARWCAPAYCIFVGLLLSVEDLAVAKKSSRVGFVACAILLFYTNYFVAIGLLAAIPVAAPMAKGSLGLLTKFVLPYMVIALFTFPGVLLFQVLDKPSTFEAMQFGNQAQFYVGAYFTFLLPAPVLAFLGWLLLTKGGAPGQLTLRKRPIGYLLALSALYIAYLSLAPWVVFRYLTMLLPVAAILLAVATQGTLRMGVPIGITFIVVTVATDVLHMDPLGYLETPGTEAADRFTLVGPVGSPLLGFLYEINHHFDAPEQVLARYLNEHADANDVVITTYDDLPLQFYTQLRIAGGLEGRQLPDDPDWLIRRRWIMSNSPGKDNDVDLLIDELVRSGNYEKVSLSYRDYQLGTNPDPRHHFFRNPRFGPLILMLRRIARGSLTVPRSSPTVPVLPAESP